MVITSVDGQLQLVRLNQEEPLDKSSSGLPRVTFIFIKGNDFFTDGNVTLKTNGSEAIHFSFNSNSSSHQLSRLIGTADKEIDIGT